MKKALLFLSILVSSLSFAQVSSTSAEIDKVQRPALSSIYNYDSKMVGDAVSAHLKDLGIKSGKNLKGWTLYEGALIEKISSNRLDYYIKVEQNGKSKDASVVYLAISKGYGNFVDANSDAELIAKATNWFSDLAVVVELHKIALDIVATEKAYENAIKEHEKSVKAGEDLAKQVEENKKDQETKKAEAEKIKASIDALKSKRAVR